jgi:flagellin-like hook-associated protein FlgL
MDEYIPKRLRDVQVDKANSRRHRSSFLSKKAARLKTFFSGALTKVGIKKEQGFPKSNTKKYFVIAILSFFIFLALVFFARGGLTGLVVFGGGELSYEELVALLGNATEKLQETELELESKEQEISKKNSEIDYKIEEVDSKQVELSGKDSEIENLKSQLEAKEDKITELEDDVQDVDEKDDEIEDLKNEIEVLEDEKDETKDIVEIAVKNFCCSLNDIQSGIVKNWSSSGGNIYCDGSHVIDCGSGDIEYNS